MTKQSHKLLASILALLGLMAISSFVPLLDAFSIANREGGMLLVLSLMIMLTGLGVWLIALAWRLYRR